MEPELPQLRNSNSQRQSFAQTLLVDLVVPSHQSIDLLQVLQSQRRPSSDQKLPKLGYQLMADLFGTSKQKVQREFINKFIFGVEMQIFRKGRIKDVTVFLDQHLPSLLWISSQTKAFLVDMSYVTLRVNDLQFQLESKCHHYFILRYFQEQIPFVFKEQKAMKEYYQVFRDFHNHHKLKLNYPPYFSKLIKHYTVTELTQNMQRSREVEEVIKTVQKISGEVSDLNLEVIKEILNAREEKNKGEIEKAQLTHEEIIDFLKIATCNENLKALFENYAQQAMKNRLDFTVPLLPVQKFKDFLIQEQKELEQSIQEWTADLNGKLSFYDFCTQIISKRKNYLSRIPKVNRNLPLTDYYIYSSHNTYLSGNQLTSDSKVQRYLEDLADGVKCMEIDVHNDGDVAIVTHAVKGIYLNKAVTFEDVIKEIGAFCRRNQGFDPIILSVENHASTANKYKMVNIFIRQLDSYLFTIEGDSELRYRTLAQLKGKVIVKTSSMIKTIADNWRKLPKQSQKQVKFDLNPPPQQFPSASFTKRQRQFQLKKSRLQLRKQSYLTQFPIKHYMSVNDEMARVTGMFKSPEGIKNASSSGFQCTSVTNQKLLKLQRAECQAYCRRSFLRIYPVASEVGSANYDPIPSLARGAQIIALNTQTRDDWAWLMMSYFTAGNQQPPTQIGFIEKPIWLRSYIQRDNHLRKIQISVLSEYFTVAIKFFGTQEDQKRNKSSQFCFTIRDYCQAFLMFQLGEYRDCIPVRFMREGYRVICGRNANYSDCGIRVLLKIKIKMVPGNQ